MVMSRAANRVSRTRARMVTDKPAKASKESVGYVDQSQSQGERCGLCEMFRLMDSCTVVEGRISACGHCRRFEPAMAEFQSEIDAKATRREQSSPFVASPANE